MTDDGKLALASGADKKFLMCPWPRAHGAKHLRPLQCQLHRTLHLPRRHRRQRNVRPDLPFASESPANKERDHMHVVLWDTKDLRQRTLHASDVLAGVMQSKAVAIPLSDGGVRLHRIVMLNGRGVNLVDLHFRLCDAGFNVAPTEVAGNASVAASVGRRESGLEVQFRRRSFITRPNQRSGVMCLMQTLSDDDGDGLT